MGRVERLDGSGWVLPLVLALLLSLSGCGIVDGVARSASGRFEVECAREGIWWTVSVAEPSDARLPQDVQEVGRFAASHRTFVTWGKDDVLWVYSGDVGIFSFRFDGSKWVESRPAAPSSAGWPGWNRKIQREIDWALKNRRPSAAP